MTTTSISPSIDFVMFYVADLEQSYAFFKDTLGFTPQPEGDGPGFRQFAGAGGPGFGLLQANEQTPPPGEVEIYLKADDLAALRDTWTARGVGATPIMQRPFGAIFEITTPDGRKLTPLRA